MNFDETMNAVVYSTIGVFAIVTGIYKVIEVSTENQILSNGEEVFFVFVMIVAWLFALRRLTLKVAERFSNEMVKEPRETQANGE